MSSFTFSLLYLRSKTFYQALPLCIFAFRLPAFICDERKAALMKSRQINDRADVSKRLVLEINRAVTAASQKRPDSFKIRMCGQIAVKVHRIADAAGSAAEKTVFKTL